MDPELKAMLELLHSQISGLGDKLTDVSTRLNSRLDSVDNKLIGIAVQLTRMETEGNNDVIIMLEMMDTKLELTAKKEDIDYLAGKLGQHDLEIDRLKRIK
ncbi:MAG: hypothetical protein K0R67_2764 [Paenibacillus sp.]|jgi:hypothetical protein|nr:hypothetical protein [Paenibacillus sp.]